MSGSRFNEELEVNTDQRNSQRLQSIYEARDRAASQLFQTFAGNVDDEELLFRAVKSYFYEVEWIINNSGYENKYLIEDAIGVVTRKDVRRYIDDGTVASNDEIIQRVTGLREYVALGPRFQVKILSGGNSRSSNGAMQTVGIPVPLRVSENAFRKLNAAMNDLDLDLKPGQGRPLHDWRKDLEDDVYNFEEVHDESA
jgi:hypothetical protein